MAERVDEAMGKFRSALDSDPLLRVTRSRQRLTKRKLIDSICKDEESCIDRRPHDYSHFLSRMQSYSPRFWFAKPELISAAQCALHGWRAVGLNRLNCRVCASILSHDESTDPAGEALRAELVSAHQDFCCWRAYRCPEHFLLYPYESETNMLLKLSKRIRAFLSTQHLRNISVSLSFECKESFPFLARLLLDAPSHLQQILESSVFEALALDSGSLPPSEEGSASGLSDLGKGVYLALCGWTMGSQELVCDCCGRRVTSRKAKEADANAPLHYILKDGLSDHRAYCPWLSHSKEGLSGWKQCAAVLNAIAAKSSIEASFDSCDISAEKVYAKIRRSLDLAASFGISTSFADD